MSRTASLQTANAKPQSASGHGILLQRKCACGGSAGLSSECEECGTKRMLGIQTKRAISEPGDQYEQEADRVAEQVMTAPTNSKVSSALPRIQRFSGHSNGQMDAAPTSVDQSLASPGRPLVPALREDMEQRFGHDFSTVRVHTGADAERSAREVNAHAYTVGHDIVFRLGRFAPGTREGRRLIAHELTHVVQQSGVDGMSVAPSNERRGLSPNEFEGEARPVVKAAPAAGTIARDPDKTEIDKPPASGAVPAFLPVEDPFLNPDALAADYALISRLLGYGFDPIAERTRGIAHPWLAGAARLGIGLLFTYPQLIPFVLTHELGHVREGRRQGWKTDLEYPKDHWWKLWSGVTDYKGSGANSPLDSLVRSAAGVNQESLISTSMVSEWERKGIASFPEALYYFLAKTNPFFYSVASQAGWLPNDDIKEYISQLGQRGTGLSPTTLSLLTGVTTAGSGGVLGIVKGIIRYVGYGDLDFEVPSYSLRGIDWTHPDLRVLLSRGGPIVGVQTVANARGRRPVELGVDVGTHTPGAAVSGKVYNLQPFGPHVLFNPFGGLSLDQESGFGFRAGADVRVPLSHGLELIATGFVEDDYLLTEALGRNKFELQFGLGLPLR
ncbi:MAG: DUF4157 domain-containing protein [Gammaproteobacteria bacterium]